LPDPGRTLANFGSSAADRAGADSPAVVSAPHNLPAVDPADSWLIFVKGTHISILPSPKFLLFSLIFLCMSALLVNEPHLIAELLSDEQQDSNVLLMEVIGDLQNDRWTIHLNVIFQSIEVAPLELLQRKTRRYYHIGCTSALVELKTRNGVIQWHTPSVRIPVNYTTSMAVENGMKVSLQPAVESKGTTFKPGGLSAKHTKTQTLSCALTSKESELVATLKKQSIRWQIDMNRGAKAYRDYLLGNYLLQAVVDWPINPKLGTLTLKPLSIAVFNEKKEQLSKKKSIWIEFLLFSLRDAKIENRDGLTFSFELHE
jgi:hypothetical protein